MLPYMRVVDIYHRDGDKLAENWVFIDMLHFMNQQGLDVLERAASLNPQAKPIPFIQLHNKPRYNTK